MKIYLLVFTTLMAAFCISCKKQVAEKLLNIPSKEAKTTPAKEPNIITTVTGTTKLGTTSGTGSDVLYIYSKDTSKLKTNGVIGVTFPGTAGTRIYAKMLWANKRNVAVFIPCGAQTGDIQLQELGAYSADGTPNVIIHKTEIFTISDLDPYINITDAYLPSDKARQGATLTILGGRFGTDPSKIQVKFPGDVIGNVIAAECDRIIVEVPAPDPAGITTGPISITITGKAAVTGPSFTFDNPSINPYTTYFFPSTLWPNRYDGSAATTVTIKALCVHPKSGNIYIWDAGSDPLKEGRIMVFDRSIGYFKNLLNTSVTGANMQNISDMDLDESENNLYVSETNVAGALWSIDLAKAKTDPTSAYTGVATNRNNYRRSIKLLPSDGSGWNALIFTQGDAGGGSDLRYTTFYGDAAFGLNQKFWYNVKDVQNPMGLDILKNSHGGYNTYVTDINTGKVLAGQSFADKNDLGFFATGLDKPSDIAISDKTTGINPIICIACKDGVRVYDKTGNYQYTLKLTKGGVTYPADFVTIMEDGKFIYAGSYQADTLFEFYNL